MSLRLLLDAHLSPRVAQQLQERSVDAVALNVWLSGTLRHASDDEILAAAYAEERVLVTYDLCTIPTLVRDVAERGEHHGGMVLVSGQRIASSDIGGQVRALVALVEELGEADWEDRAHFL